jgi:uncharacterized phosphosugar-binding protein
MNAAERYLSIATGQISAMARSQGPAIEQAAELVADSLAEGHRIWVAATTHVLHSELWLRAGGLVAVHQIGGAPDLSKPMYGLEIAASLGDGRFEPEPGDVAIVGSNAGTDAGTVEIAVAATRAGCRVIALTCIAFESYPDVLIEHPSGRRLMDVAHLAIDIGGLVGDAVLELPGLDHPVAPTSGVTLVACAWAIMARAAEQLASRGLRPIVYRAVQLPGAEAEFVAKKARYEETRIGVEPIPEDVATDS